MGRRRLLVQHQQPFTPQVRVIPKRRHASTGRPLQQGNNTGRIQLHPKLPQARAVKQKLSATCHSTLNFLFLGQIMCVNSATCIK